MDSNEENESRAERRVVYETVNASTTKNSAPTIVVIAVVAIALIIWLVTQIF